MTKLARSFAYAQFQRIHQLTLLASAYWFSAAVLVDVIAYVAALFADIVLDASGPAPTNAIESGADTGSDSDKHIPRPPNSWILYRQAKSRELSREFPGITASELCQSLL
jgi:hypothetical protein